MRTAPTTGRNPFVAVVLSLLATGLGHVYCGRVVTGLVLFLVSLLFAPVAALAAYLRPSTAVLVLLLSATAAVLGVYVFAVFDAYRQARRSQHGYEPKEYNRGLVYALFVLVGVTYPVGIVHYVRSSFFEGFLVPTASESPNILPGDHVLANKAVFRGRVPDRGEIVVFRHPANREQNWIKRVIALPGDTVAVRGNEVHVNGKRLARDRVSPASLAAVHSAVEGEVFEEVNGGRRYRVMFGPDPAKDFPEQKVPAGSCFVLGDNRNKSRDSREFGFIPLENVFAKVEYVYLPAASWSRFGAVPD